MNEFHLFTSKPLLKPETAIFETDPVTSIFREPRAEVGIKLYPIPVGETLHIGFPVSLNEMNFQVYDIHGRTLLYGTFPIGESLQTVSTENLSPDIYGMLPTKTKGGQRGLTPNFQQMKL